MNPGQHALRPRTGVLFLSIGLLATPSCLLNSGPLESTGASTSAAGAAGAAGTAGTAGRGGEAEAGGAGGTGGDGGTTTVTPVCGNGVLEADEECDSAVPSETTCESLSYPPGTLACTPGCHIDATSCTQGEVWWDAAWAYRKRITVDGAMSPRDWDSFTTLIPIVDPALVNARPDGADLVFLPKDGGEPLAHEIELFDAASGALVAWVNIPAFKMSEVRELTLYFGNPTAEPVPPTTPVWPESYSAVWHLGEAAVNGQSATVHKDSTSAGHTGAQHGNAVAPGKVGMAQSFDGSDWIDVMNGGQIVLSNTDCAISAWIQTTETGEQALVTKSPSSTHTVSDILTGTGHNGPYFGMDSHSVNFIRGTTNVTDGAWHYVVWSQSRDTGEFSKDEWRIYVDGQEQGQSANYTNGDNPTFAVKIGAGVKNSYFAGSWKGLIDEVRISTVFRDSAWSIATYNNQANPSMYVKHQPAQKAPPSSPPD